MLDYLGTEVCPGDPIIFINTRNPVRSLVKGTVKNVFKKVAEVIYPNTNGKYTVRLKSSQFLRFHSLIGG